MLRSLFCTALLLSSSVMAAYNPNKELAENRSAQARALYESAVKRDTPAAAPRPGSPAQLPAASATPKLRQATRDQVVKSLTRSKRKVRRSGQSHLPPPPTIIYDTTEYVLFHSGSGFIETDDNPSNTYDDVADLYPPMSRTYPGSTSQAAVLEDCAAFARDPDYYFAFQVYYTSGDDTWTCRVYYHAGVGGDADSDSSYFNVAQPDAGPVYGYQVERTA